ncbi:beta strand repeat-containing protein, partial [Bartonella sp. MU37NMGALS]|uniref:beta strand repeat-containing protein n=1 Tax=Bartonella sp. MU37NMGALS TaxID=3243560 RepID=UPI0035CFA171
MYKKSLLSYTATVAIILSSIYSNAHAESLEASGEGQSVIGETGKSYEILHAKESGKITGENLTVTGNKDTNENSNPLIPPSAAVTSEGEKSMITLTGDKTAIKGTDSDIRLGLEAKDDAILQMTGGTITISNTGVHFLNSNSKENKLEKVTISSGKDDAPLLAGIRTDKSTVNLENVKVTQATSAVVANKNSTITISGGSFETKGIAVGAHNGSTITLNNNVQITSENTGLHANALNSTITMTGGEVTGKDAALSTTNGGHIKATDVTLKTKGNGYGAFANGSGSLIELLGNTTIHDAEIGLSTQDSGTIKMTEGTITASIAGAGFLNSNSTENHLENVTISSSKNDVLLNYGIKTDKSTVTLKNVTVSQAINGIFANDHSTITVLEGSFSGNDTGVQAQNGSTITMTKGNIKTSKFGVFSADAGSVIKLLGDTKITDSEIGLGAGKGGAIIMNGGTITASITGAGFLNSNSTQNTLEDVTIMSGKVDAPINIGVVADQNSIVALKNVTVTQANKAIIADHSSAITISGGSFDAKGAAIIAQNGSTITMTKGTVTGENGTLWASTGGHITVTDVTLKTKEAEFSAFASGDNSVIELLGNTTISDSDVGLEAEDNAIIKMTGGNIKTSKFGAVFSNSKSDKNKLEEVTISGKDHALLELGVVANLNSTVALKNIKVTQAQTAVMADNSSTVTISSGSFDAKGAAIGAINGSTIILTDAVQITSSENIGLYAQDSGSTITMTKGSITGKDITLSAENGGHIKVTDVSLKTTDGNGLFGAFVNGPDSVIELLGDTKINDSTIGLGARDGGVIKMTGGTITTSMVGAGFLNSNSTENHLENVTISSGKKDAPLDTGIKAEKNSTIALKNVTVTQAKNAIVANDHSTVTISGGSFDAKEAAIISQNGSTITMTKGNVIGKDITLSAENGGHITATDVTLKTTDGDGIGAGADGSNSVIKLLGNTTISDSNIGIGARNGGAISMKGGSIKASVAGAVFSKSESEENYLDNVIISSGKDGALLGYGIEAEEKSKVTLKNVTISDAINAVAAYDNSTIKISGGSFKAEDETIYVADGGTINLDDAAQITSSHSYGLHADGLNSTITMNEGHVKGNRTALSAEDGGHITVTGVIITTEKQLSGLGASVINSNSMIELRGTNIRDTSTGLLARDGGVIKMNKGSITTSAVGATVLNSKSNENKLEDVTISSNGKGNSAIFTGLNSQASNVILENVHITQAFTGVIAMDHSQITISGGSFAGNNVGILAESGSTITLAENAQIKSSNGYALHATGLDSTITMTKGSITGKEAALAVENGGHIDATNIFATAERNGIKFENPEEDTTSEINLTNAKLHIKNGIGINVDESTGTVNLGKKSEIHGDVLLVTKDSTKGNNFTFTLNSDDSILEGRAKIINSPKTIFNLQNNTQWIVKTSTNEKDDDGNLLDIAQRSRSDISTLNLDNSSIIFSEPTEEHYHTLHIGSGKPDTQEVYNATGNAKIYFNIAWSDGLASADQKTDRLLIHGDVSGSTTVYIDSDSGNKDSVVNAADPSNIGGLSLIQVSGKAQEDSFKLANGYTTRDRLPYKYTLTAYGPESSHGQADVAQSLFDEKNKNFWDFRLHKEILETGSGSGPSVATLVPQTASYLVMPNALFHAGLTDIAKQDEFLANMRISTVGQGIKNAFFLYTYGSTGTLSSERGPLKYGYGADIR